MGWITIICVCLSTNRQAAMRWHRRRRTIIEMVIMLARQLAEHIEHYCTTVPPSLPGRPAPTQLTELAPHRRPRND
jgi:hypothetical protein